MRGDERGAHAIEREEEEAGKWEERERERGISSFPSPPHVSQAVVLSSGQTEQHIDSSQFLRFPHKQHRLRGHVNVNKIDRLTYPPPHVSACVCVCAATTTSPPVISLLLVSALFQEPVKETSKKSARRSRRRGR